ncbi:ISL3 family transposase [Peptostreptococcus porci]|uniref:ISL3 family transposase n=1 Tax=Peptostreptococcus porci TaxID=2652282 RepID=UPI0023F131C0|nr:ISL3 family transposase [Peptostreptococcus porci]MDD7182084.1 ISL3 family transposase [Peptostreptococcus porci]
MFSSNSISNILGIGDKNLVLTGEEIFETIKSVKYCVLNAILTYEPSHCPHCNSNKDGHNIVKNGSQMVKIVFNRAGNNPILLRVKKQRFYCKSCQKTFMAKTSLTSKGCFISNDVKRSIIGDLCEFKSIKLISKEHYVSSSTVNRVLRSTEVTNRKHHLPEVLGIDEFKSTKSVDASMSVNLVDVSTGKIIDLVSDRRKFNLKEYFSSYPLKVREKVRYITTDIYAPYIDIAREMFPNAKIVLDKFHIVQLMTRNMNIKRVNIMKTMKTNTHNYRVLKRYWKIILAKEWELNSVEFYSYRCYKNLTNSSEILREILSFNEELKDSHKFYQHFLQSVELRDVDEINKILDKYLSDIPECFHTSISTLKKHREYVINAIETTYSNASVEGNNNIIKTFKKISFGFRSFRNLRARILLRNRYKICCSSSSNELDTTA